MGTAFRPGPLAAWACSTLLFAQLAAAQDFSLRFRGHGVDAPDLDRVKIQIDEPGNDDPGPPADVGATDFTIELWLKANAADNTAGPVACGSNINWILGNIVLDRDRYNQDRKFGLSIAGGNVVFGVSGDGTGDRTICGSAGVLDGLWHHIVVQRRRSDGHLWLYVDGVLQDDVDGPDGDISYPDDGVPCASCCGGPCTNSDPFIVLGAEKHDAGAAYPSYNGFLDELRFSDSLRYSTDFTPANAPFVVDGNTAALYHFDEGPAGACTGAIIDSAGGASPGQCQYGGTAPSGPEYSTDTPFNPAPPAQDSMVRPLRPLKVRIREGIAAVTKKLRVMVRNNDVDPNATQTVQLAAANIDCPASIIQSAPDFERSTPGAQDTITLRGRQTKTAVVLLNVAAADFVTFNRKAPARCTLSFTSSSTAPGNLDPSPANNSMTIEINVFDANDAEQAAVHETVMESVRVLHPGKVEIPPGAAMKEALVRITVINADSGEDPGDVITVTADHGDCPAGTVGIADFDRGTPGPQSSVTVPGVGKARGLLPLTIDASQFDTVEARSPSRCTALLTATGPGGDTDAGNNTTRLVIDVIDLGDL